MSSRIEEAILKSCFKSSEFIAKIYPFLKEEYFTESSDKTIFQQVKTYIDQYHVTPTIEAIFIQMDGDKSINEAQQQGAVELLETIQGDQEDTPYEWLYDQTEKFCKDKAIYNAITQAINIADGNDKLSPDAIPSILQDALAISFSTDIGHDYFADAGLRYDAYHTKQDKIPFLMKTFNHITNNGLPRKTLSCILGGSGTGKSQWLCSLAADYIKQGYNVVYFTMEMTERKIAERVDADLLDVDISSLFGLNRQEFNARMDKVKNKTQGKLIIKEYPTSSAHAGHFRQFLLEAKHKKGFVPDVIIVDYLGICASSKIKLGASVNNYNVMKSVAEEVRALCQEFDAVGWTGAQANRSGYNNSDIDVTNVADSLGILYILDFFIGLVLDDGMEEDGEILVTQLKNRYGSTAFKRFRMTMNRSRMRITDRLETLSMIEEFKGKKQMKDVSTQSVAGEVDQETGEVVFGRQKVKPSFSSLSFDE